MSSTKTAPHAPVETGVNEVDASFVPRTAQNIQEENQDWENKWTNILQTEMQNYLSIDLFCCAMLTQMDLNFPQNGEVIRQPSYLRIAAALDMLDIMLPVLGPHQPVMTRLRDEFVRAIYMPEKRKGTNDSTAETGNFYQGTVRKCNSTRLNTLLPLAAQRGGVRGVKGGGTEAVREGGSYFSRTPYFKSGIRTVNDHEFLRGLDKLVKGLEHEKSVLTKNVKELKIERTVLEKRIEGFQMREQILEQQTESNTRKWENKIKSLEEEVDSLSSKLEEAMLTGLVSGKSRERQKLDGDEEHHSGADYGGGHHGHLHHSQTMPVSHMSLQDAEVAQKRHEHEIMVLGLFQTLSTTLIELSRKEVEGVCGEMRATTNRFENTATMRMLLKTDETHLDLDRIKNEDLLTRWISCTLKQAFKDGKLRDGAAVMVNNLTTDLDDGMVLIDIFSLVLPDKYKWPEEKLQSARCASLEKRGEFFASTMVALTNDAEWEEFDFFSKESTLDKRCQFLSLLFLVLSDGRGSVWGPGLQLASNMNKVQDTAENIEHGAEKLMKTLKEATNSKNLLNVLGPLTGSALCEAVATFIANAKEVRSAVSDANQVLSDMHASTVSAQIRLLRLFSAKSNVMLKIEANKLKEEFERGKDAGFQEAKDMGLAHANMQRKSGQVIVFSRNRIKLGFSKLLLGNLNMDRFSDIATIEFEKGISPEQFVRWMEQCANSALHHYTAIVKLFRCYGRLEQHSENDEELLHPTPKGITIHVEQWMALLHDAKLLRLERDYSNQRISPLTALLIFRTSCRIKFFHYVDEDEIMLTTLDDAVSRVKKTNDRLMMPGLVEGLSRVAWTIIRQLSPLEISKSTVHDVFTCVATRCEQVDIDHFLTTSSSSQVKDQLKVISHCYHQNLSFIGLAVAVVPVEVCSRSFLFLQGTRIFSMVS